MSDAVNLGGTILQGSYFGACDDLKLLVVGDRVTWRARGLLPWSVAGCTFAEHRALTAPLMRRCAPDLVLSPLFGQGFDALDVAHRLHAVQFQGRLRVLAVGVPDPALICAELRAAAPGADVDILLLRPDCAERPRLRSA